MTEVKQQWAMLVLGWVTASVSSIHVLNLRTNLSVLLVSLMALWLTLVDQNPFRPCYHSPRWSGVVGVLTIV